MMPTGWGWITIVSGLAAVFACFYWGQTDNKKRAAGISLGAVLVFLFSFMQWASWYK